MDVFQGPKYTSGTNLQQLNTNSKLSLFKIFREATRDVLLKKLFLKVLQYWQELNKRLKRDSNTSIFLWNRKIFENTFFTEHLRTTASVFHYLQNKFGLFL